MQSSNVDNSFLYVAWKSFLYVTLFCNCKFHLKSLQWRLLMVINNVKWYEMFTYSWLSLCWIQKYISITKILADIFLNHSSKKRQNFIITIFLWISYYLLPSALMCKMHIGLVRSLTLWFSFQTNSGTVLISINPYKKLPFYTPDVIDIYRCHCLYALPPHM